MSVYIIRPKTTEVTRSLNLASRKLTPESRTAQVAEVENFWQEDTVYQEITTYLEDAEKIKTYPTYSNITGAKVAEIPDDEIDQVRHDLPNAVILRDQPIELIQPQRSTAGAKSQLNQNDLWHLDAIALTLARKQGFTGTGKNISVAVLDTGIDDTHPELKGKIIESYSLNSRTREIQTLPSKDTDGHGTHVAGLICGEKVGVAPETKIINAMMFPQGTANFSDWIIWLQWLATQPQINIVNISAGRVLSNDHFDQLSLLIDDLIEVGILPVCAVGNEGHNRSRTPGNCQGSLSVGATNNQKKIASFSGNSKMVINHQSYNVPYLVAPGEGVYSSVLGGGYEAWNGTSMATPIVSGVAALILEKYNQNMSVLDLLALLNQGMIELNRGMV